MFVLKAKIDKLIAENCASCPVGLPKLLVGTNLLFWVWVSEIEKRAGDLRSALMP
jgi:hypothetical protein